MKYIDADRLRKEIEHRIDILADVSIKCAKNDDIEMHNYYHGKAISLDELLSFIDSLQQEQPEVFDTVAFQKGVEEGRRLEREEPVSDCHDLKKHMKEWLELMVGASFPEQDGDFISEEDYRSVIKKTALHFAEWGADHLRDTKKKVSEDLEEAARAFVGFDMDCDELYEYETGIAAFKAGAEWQLHKNNKNVE